MELASLKLLHFKDDGHIPNHPRLPVLLYEGALEGKENETKEIFLANGWSNSWTNGVFGYHHYHSNTHEALAVIRGSATLKLGGEYGQEVTVKKGDLLVLPAGTGHKKIDSSPDFSVVGAYPEGMDYNLKTGSPGERPHVLEEIARVPMPERDPVFGPDGPLVRCWKA